MESIVIQFIDFKFIINCFIYELLFYMKMSEILPTFTKFILKNRF